MSAIKNAFKRVEDKFLKLSDNSDKAEASGSCALICLTVGKIGVKLG